MCKKTKVYIDGEEFWIMCEQLAKKIKKGKEEFSGIYCILRGGMAVSLYLSHYLNLPILNKPDKECLLVDEIKETGLTSKKYPRKKFACLYTTPWTDSPPDYFIKMKKNKNSWIVFPWEDFSEDGVKDCGKKKIQKN